MKWSFLFLSVLFIGTACAQTAAHFINPGYEFYFEYDDQEGEYHSISIIDSLVIGDTKYLYPHKVVIDSGTPFESLACDFCSEYQTADNIFGPFVESHAEGNWTFLNSSSDSLFISVDNSDSTLIYQSDVLEYYLSPVGSSTRLLFGELIDVFTYELKCYFGVDLYDVETDSVEFAYSSEYGFLNFFVLKDFPSQQRTYSIRGHSEYDSGPIVWSDMRFAEWSIGDTLVYRHYVSTGGSGSVETFKRHAIYAESISTDQVVYYTNVLEQVNYDCFGCPMEPELSNYDDSLRFSDLNYTLDYPLNNLGSSGYQEYSMSDTMFNDIPRHIQSFHANYYEPCDSVCFIAPLGLYSDVRRSVEGLGPVFIANSYDDGSSSSYTSQTLVAYQKGSEIYGSLGVISALNELESVQFNVYPNPAIDIIRIEGQVESVWDEMVISNILGQEVKREYLAPEYRVGELESGVYLLSLYLNNTLIHSRRLVKE